MARIKPSEFWLPEEGAYQVVPMRGNMPEARYIVEKGRIWYAEFYDENRTITDIWVMCANLVFYHRKDTGNGESALRVVEPAMPMKSVETEKLSGRKVDPAPVDHEGVFEDYKKFFTAILERLPEIKVFYIDRGDRNPSGWRQNGQKPQFLRGRRTPAPHINEGGRPKPLCLLLSPNP